MRLKWLLFLCFFQSPLAFAGDSSEITSICNKGEGDILKIHTTSEGTLIVVRPHSIEFCDFKRTIKFHRINRGAMHVRQLSGEETIVMVVEYLDYFEIGSELHLPLSARREAAVAMFSSKGDFLSVRSLPSGSFFFSDASGNQYIVASQFRGHSLPPLPLKTQIRRYNPKGELEWEQEYLGLGFSLVRMNKEEGFLSLFGSLYGEEPVTFNSRKENEWSRTPAKGKEEYLWVWMQLDGNVLGVQHWPELEFSQSKLSSDGKILTFLTASGVEVYKKPAD